MAESLRWFERYGRVRGVNSNSGSRHETAPFLQWSSLGSSSNPRKDQFNCWSLIMPKSQPSTDGWVRQSTIRSPTPRVVFRTTVCVQSLPTQLSHPGLLSSRLILFDSFEMDLAQINGDEYGHRHFLTSIIVGDNASLGR